MGPSTVVFLYVVSLASFLKIARYSLRNHPKDGLATSVFCRDLSDLPTKPSKLPWEPCCGKVHRIWQRRKSEKRKRNQFTATFNECCCRVTLQNKKKTKKQLEWYLLLQSLYKTVTEFFQLKTRCCPRLIGTIFSRQLPAID